MLFIVTVLLQALPFFRNWTKSRLLNVAYWTEATNTQNEMGDDDDDKLHLSLDISTLPISNSLHLTIIFNLKASFSTESWQSSSQYCDKLWTGWLRSNSQQRQDFFSSLLYPDQIWGPDSLLSNRFQGMFPQDKSAGARNWPLTSF
jgi:hypothetical protein